MSEGAIIETRGLGRQYGRRWVVNELDLAVPRGAVYGFLGLNGAGKSTTIRMLMGLIRRHAGEARVLGLDPARQEVELKRRVGYVAENPAFYEWMTVAEICAFVAHYRQGTWDARRAEDLMRKFRLQPDVKLKHLSKGQRAKTALVLAMAFDPELLMLDEPTSGLDPLARREFIEGVLAEFQESGKTIFISSHLVNELSGLIDYVGILHEGRLLYSGPADEFRASVRRLRLTFGDAPPPDVRCDGLLRRKSNGRDTVLSVRDFDETRILTQLREYHPADIQIEPLNLEDSFVEFIGGELGEE